MNIFVCRVVWYRRASVWEKYAYSIFRVHKYFIEISVFIYWCAWNHTVEKGSAMVRGNLESHKFLYHAKTPAAKG
jgi:hypothetical protein